MPHLLLKKTSDKFDFRIKKFLLFAVLLVTVQFSFAQTYTWQGADGADWTVATNWSPTRAAVTISDVLLFNNGGTYSVSNIPTESISQLLISNSTDVSFTTSANSILTIRGLASTVNFSIEANSNLQLSSVGANNIIVRYYNISSQLGEIHGTLTINPNDAKNNTFRFTDYSAITTVENGGLIINKGGVITGATTRLQFLSGAEYRHDTDGLAVPTATWDANSLVNITGIISTRTTAGIQQTFGHLTWNCPAQNAPVIFTNSTITCNGNFRIVSTGTGSLEFSDTNRYIYVNGDFLLEGGDVYLNNTSTRYIYLYLAGNFTQTGGNLARGTATGISRIYFRSNTIVKSYSKSGGTYNSDGIDYYAEVNTILNINSALEITSPRYFYVQNNATVYLNSDLTGSGVFYNQSVNSITHLGSNINTTCKIDNRGKLHLYDYVISGTGEFDHYSYDLYIGHADGVNLIANLGNVQVSGVRTYRDGANYFYNGTVAQITGDGLDVCKDLTINNAAGVTLSQYTYMSSTASVLYLTDGILELDDYKLTLRNPSTTIAVVGTPTVSNMITTSGTGYFEKYFNTNELTSFIFPLGDNIGSVDYSPATVRFSSNSAGYLAVKVTDNVHPNVGSATDYITRYWSTTTTMTSYNYNFDFSYQDAADVFGNIANMNLSRYNGAIWNAQPSTIGGGNMTYTVSPLNQVNAPLSGSDYTALYEEFDCDANNGYLSEPFSSTALPLWWTRGRLSGSYDWKIQNSPAMSSSSGGYYAAFDDNWAGTQSPNDAWLKTPNIEFCGVTSLFLSYEEVYTGTEDQEAIVEINTDGGATDTWTIIHTNTTADVGTLGAPFKRILDLTPFVSNYSNIIVRFRFNEHGSTGKYWYVDDINIYAGEDIGPSELVSPAILACTESYTATEQVTFRMFNYSFEDVTGADWSLSVKNGAGATIGSFTGTYAGIVPANDYVDIPVTATFDMSAEDVYHFTITTSHAGDGRAKNNTLLIGRQSVIETFPYTVAFEDSPSGWSTGGDNPEPTNSGYMNNNGREFLWGELPYLNGAEGEGKSWFVNTTRSNLSDYVWLESPVFDLTNNSTPVLSFDLKHSLHNDDYFHVQYQIDGGTWTLLGGPIDPQWYNNASWWRNSQASPVDSWTQMEYDLCSLSGESCVKFRFRGRPYYSSPTYSNYHLFAVDNVQVTGSLSDDVEPLVITQTHAKNCGSFTSSEPVQVLLKNNGCRPLTNFNVELTVDASVIATETVNITVPSFGAELYTFTATADLSAAGTHIIEVKTLLGSDNDNTNDIVKEKRMNSANTAYPYMADFNTDADGCNNDGWVSQTTVGHRYFRNDPVDYLNGPEGEGECFFVETSQSNKSEWITLESPVFNLDGLSDPILYLDIKHSLHNDDYFRVRYTVNGGSTWITLGSTEPNWYNTNAYWRNSYASPVDEWTQVVYSLCTIADLTPAEKQCVKFKVEGRPYYSYPNYEDYHKFAIDNFQIVDNPEVGVIAITNPNAAASTCLYDANQTVSISVYNFGCGTVYNVPVSVQIDLPVGHPDFASSPLTFVGTVPQIDPQSSASYTFLSTFDMRPLGTYTFDSWTSLPGDTHASNDHETSTIDVLFPKISTYPHLENFDDGHESYWTASGDNPPANNGRNFVRGDLTYLNGPEGNGQSWFVETTASNKSDYIWVESPVFDLSENSNPVMYFDLKHSLHNDDYFHVQYQIDGGTWTLLGGPIDPLWYNSTSWWRNSHATPVDSWTQMEYDLCFLSGKSCVKFRLRGRPYYSAPSYANYHLFAFDNFSITGGLSDDVEPIAITLPNSTDCAGNFTNTETVQVLLKNNLCRPLSNFNVELYLNGGLQATENVNVAVPAFGAVLYTFIQTLDMSAAVPNPATITVKTLLVSDMDNTNDSYSETRVKSSVNTFPFIADFNTGNDGFVSSTTVGHRYFRNGALPYLNGAEGNGNSWYVDTHESNKGEWISVESPTFDISAMNDPMLLLDIKHSLHNDDYFRVRYSLNGGASWIQLGTTEPGWYNTNSYWRNSSSTPVDSWKTVQKNLCTLKGESCVKFKIEGRPYYSSPNYSDYHKFAFDNFIVTEAVDVSVTEILAPLPADNGCTFLTNQIVEVRAFNSSCSDQTNVPVECVISLPAGHPLAPSITLTGTIPNIPNNDYATYTFVGTFDMTPIGTYGFDAYTALVGDFNPANDNTTSSILVEFPKLSTFPYSEDFNGATPHYWLAREDAPSGADTDIGRHFYLGQIPYLNGEEGNDKSWYVDATISNKSYNIWVESPVFDFSTLTKPVISLDIKHSLHNDDYFRVEYSIDGGSSWVAVDDAGTEPDWYNTSAYWRNSHTAAVDSWTTARHDVCSLAGEPCVKFRVKGRPYYSSPTYTDYHKFAFDNFKIIDGLEDISVVQYISPLPADEYCSFPTTQELTVQVYNPGCTALLDVPLVCDITGAITQTLNGTFDIPAKSYINYTFSTTIDMTTLGDYNFHTYTTLATDFFADNNDIYETISVDDVLINTFPYVADFNSGQQYWREGGDNPPSHGNRDFVHGQFSYLNTNESNGDAWYVEATGNNASYIWVESPVFDLSETLNPILSMEVKYQLHNDNYFQVQYSTNGGQTWSQLGASSADWYNNTGWWRNNAQDAVNSWKNVQWGLCQVKGYSCVKFRVRGRPYYGSTPHFFAFDNFTISDPLIDAELLSITGCYGDAQDYTLNVEVGNNNNTCQRFEPCVYDGGHDLLFDGTNDRVSLGAMPALTNFTVEYWVKHNGTDGTQERITSTTSNRFETTKSGTGRLQCYAAGWKNSGIDLPEGKWSHVAWINNGSQIILYLNGENVYSTNISFSIAASDWYLGGYSISGSNANISLDEVRLWNKALSEDELRTNICNSLTGAEADLISYYDMESNIGTTILVDVAGTNNGTLENFNIANSCWVTPAPQAFAGSNTALQFDGVNDRVGTPELPALINWTTEYWVYNPGGTTNYRQNVVAESSRFESVIMADEILDFYAVGKVGWTTTNITVDVGAWTHIAITSDGSQVYFYKNGILAYTHPNTITILPSNWYIGARDIGSSPNNSIIDEVRIWDETRSQAQIAANMSSTIAAQANLIAYYPLEDGVGSYIATDASGNGYNGTLLQMEVGSCWETSNLVTNNNGVAEETPAISSIDISYQIDGGGTVTNTFNAPADFAAIPEGGSEVIIIPFERVEGAVLGNNLISVGGTASASTERNANNTADKAFDGDIETYGWGNTNSLSSWLAYDLGAGNENAANAFRIFCSNTQDGGWNSEIYNPDTWVFQASNNGSTWVDLNSITHAAMTMNQWFTVYFTNITNYRYYRINISSAESGSYTHITELQIFNINPEMSDVAVTLSAPNGEVDQIISNNIEYVDISNFPSCNDFCPNAIKITNAVTSATSNANATEMPGEDENLFQLCTSVVADNTSWYYFRTNCRGGEVDLNITDVSCSPNGTGINVNLLRHDIGAAVDDVICVLPPEEELWCDFAESSADATFNSITDYQPTGLLSEQNYYIVIDGSGNNTCDFKIELGGNVEFNPADAMNGIYTIDPASPTGGTNFQTVIDAVDNLDEYGISTNVVFNMVDTEYNEQVTFPLICSSDPANTITFTTDCDNCALATIGYDATDASDNFTADINFGRNYIFDKIRFEALDPNFSRTVKITNYTQNIIFRNCEFTAPATISNSNDNILVYSATESSSKITFENSKFINGSQAVYFEGDNSSTLSSEMQILNNVFENQSYRNISLINMDAPIISNNSSETNSTRVDFTGIYMKTVKNNANVSGNQTYATAASGTGIFLDNVSGDVTDQVGIYNNMFSIGTASNTSYGIDIVSTTGSTEYVNLYYNSFNTTSTAGAALRVNTANNMVMKNNIFNSASAVSFDQTVMTLATIDYNDFVPAYAGGTNFFNIAPGFITNNNLHTENVGLQVGTAIAGITLDIDGETRQAPPYLGADEFLGTVSWTGAVDTDWNLPGNWSSNQVPTHGTTIQIPTVTNYPELNSKADNLAEVKHMTIDLGAHVFLPQGKFLTIYGDLNLNGELKLLSTAAGTGSASLITYGSVNYGASANFVQEQFISSAKWHYMSSPVQNASLSIFNPDNLYSYNETVADAWLADDFTGTGIMGWVAPSETNAVTMKGYIGYENEHVKSFVGNPNTEMQTINLDFTDNTATHSNANFDGWNLIGNPYPSYINWNAEGLVKTNVDNALYFYDDDGSNDFNNYKYYVTGSQASPYPSIAVNNGNCYIPPTQAFFVRANAPGANVQVDNQTRCHDDQPFYRAEGEQSENVIRLRITNNDMSDETVVRFLQPATEQYDGEFDAFKLFPYSDVLPYIYTKPENSSFGLAISTYSTPSVELVIPLAIRTANSGFYSIDFTQLNLQDDYVAYLEDVFENRTTRIREEENYEFFADGNNLPYSTRFNIRFEQGTSTLGEIVNQDVLAYANLKNIHIKIYDNSLINSRIRITDMVGKLVVDKRVASEEMTIDMNSYSAGNYFIEISNEHAVIRKQVFVGE